MIKFIEKEILFKQDRRRGRDSGLYPFSGIPTLFKLDECEVWIESQMFRTLDIRLQKRILAERFNYLTLHRSVMEQPLAEQKIWKVVGDDRAEKFGEIADADVSSLARDIRMRGLQFVRWEPVYLTEQEVEALNGALAAQIIVESGGDPRAD